MKLKRLALNALGGLMAVALAACMLTSCGKSAGSADTLVENIPSSSVFVLKINPQQVLENAGCSVDNGKIVLSQKYSDVIKENAGAAMLNVVNQYLAYTEGIKLDAIMLFSADAGAKSAAMTALVSDAEPVKAHLKDLFGNQTEENGYTVFKNAGVVIAVNDKMMWVADNMAAIERISAEAAKSNLASVGGVGEFLADDNAFAFVVSLPEIEKTLKAQGIDVAAKLERNDVPAPLAEKIAGAMKYYACGSMAFKGNTVSGEFFLVDKDGKRSEFGKVLNVIDTDFLANVPADANAVMACGNIGDADLKSAIDSAVADYKAKAGDSQDAQYLDLLTLWDGTAALAFECNDLIAIDPASLVNMSEMQLVETVFSKIKCVAMAHYPAEVVEKYAARVFDFMRNTGATPDYAGKGYYKVDFEQGFSLYFGNRYGYLTFANFDIKSNANTLADKFAGKHLAIYSKAEANPVMARFGWNYGSEGMLWLDDDALRFKMELTGTSANYLQAFIEPLTDMNNLQNLMQYFMEMERSVGNSYGSYDEPDFDDYYDYSEDY